MVGCVNSSGKEISVLGSCPSRVKACPVGTVAFHTLTVCVTITCALCTCIKV